MPDTDWPAILREDIKELTKEVREAIVLAHSPGSCPPLEELRKEAKNSSVFREQVKGAWKAIGILGGLVGASLGAGVVIFAEWLGKR